MSDYSANAFLAAFHRYAYSDCGTTFKGADGILYREFLKIHQTDQVQASIANDRFVWKFNTPADPHFSKIWEAGVKSVKTHLKRIIADFNFTFEEFSTILYQIEALLNSRLIEPLSDSTDDLNPLTPGHFLVGEPLIAVPRMSLLKIISSHLNRWLAMQKSVQSF